MSIIYLKAIDRNNGSGNHIIKADIESVVEDVYQIVDTYNQYKYTFNLKTSLLKSTYPVKNYDCGRYEMQELTEISEIGYLKYRMQNSLRIIEQQIHDGLGYMEEINLPKHFGIINGLSECIQNYINAKNQFVMALGFEV